MGPAGGSVGAAGSRGLESDPIFQAQPPAEASARSTLLLWQFFLFPLLVVAVAVGIFVFFGMIGGSKPTMQELMTDLRQGGENEQKQAAQQIAGRLTEADVTEDPEVRGGLRAALATALASGDATEDRKVWLAIAVGRVAPRAPSEEGRATASLLLSALYPGERPAQPTNVRIAAAHGLKDMESRDAEGALLKVARDPDPEVRNVALNGLALLGLPRHGGSAADSPEVRPLLLEALEDAHGGVRQNAAIALALRGDPAGLPIVERSLRREGLEELGILGPKLQENALMNAIVAARFLAHPTLRPLVERLADSATEPNQAVRAHAAENLRQWRSS
jgi:hypothetical protein